MSLCMYTNNLYRMHSQHFLDYLSTIHYTITGSHDLLTKTTHAKRPSSAKTKIKNLLKRPLSGRHKSTLSKLQWRLKREEMVKIVYKHSEVKQKSITCPCQLEIEIDSFKHIPKLTLKVFPYGLFEDEGKAVSLQVSVTTHKKSPPIPPSLLLLLTVTVLDDKGKPMRERSTEQSLNMSCFYLTDLLSHCELLTKLQGDIVQLMAAVQLLQSPQPA